MRCVDPFVTTAGAFGCGQCLPCRFNKRRTWTHRILLEALSHGEKNCSFVTLTYEDMPADRSVSVAELQLWLKRLRKYLSPRRVRYFCVGEYGDRSWRPHYHAALFGLGPCSAGGVGVGECECAACSAVRQTWGFGHVMVAPLTKASAQYIAGYVTKKMTSNRDERLDGRSPEFARMSLRPGIGADAMWDVASVLLRYGLETRGDVPAQLRYGATVLPLGRYLQKKLRIMVGKDEKAPPEALQEGANKLSILRSFAFANDRSVASVFQEINEPYASRLAAKAKLREDRSEAL